MGERVRLTNRHLLNTLMKFPVGIIRDDSYRTYYLALAVVKYFLGIEWLDKHLDPYVSEPGFLRQNFTTLEGEIQSYRLVDLAELLFNLQDVEGLDLCIDRMQKGMLESTYAELDFGRMLYMGGINFRYVTPEMVKGSDYDIEIRLPDGVVVCADAKCKLDSTEFSEGTIKNSLLYARKQFPPDKPSAIFVKTPASWGADPNMGQKLIDIANDFLRGTKRIVSVKFYAVHLLYRDGMLTHIQAFKEISNPRNKFDPKRNWDMFAEAGPLPKLWQRIMHFPKGVGDGEVESTR